MIDQRAMNRHDRCLKRDRMHRTITHFLFLVFVVHAPFAAAQTTVSYGSYAFSDGVHPTFAFIFEGTDTRYVESWWKDELKKISMDVSSKKELIGSGVLLPQVSPDTVRVMMKADQRRNAPMLTAHVAILTKAGWLDPNSDAGSLEGARMFVQQRSTLLRMQLAQQELTEAEKGLAILKRDLANLDREKERAEAGIVKSREKAADAVREQGESRAEADALTKRIEAQQQANIKDPGEEGDKALKYLMKDHERALKQNEHALEQERSMLKKAEELTWDVRKNVEDQARKSEAIAQQEQLVNAMRAKLAAIE